MNRQTKLSMLEKNAISGKLLQETRVNVPGVLVLIAIWLAGVYFPSYPDHFLAPPACYAAESVQTQVSEEPDSSETSIELEAAPYQELFDELVNKHGFERQELLDLFSGLTLDQKALIQITDQAESSPYLKYLALLATPAIIQVGKDKLEEFRELLEKIEEQYGVDREYLIAIWGIETRFGQRQGKHEVFRVLNTLFTEYPRRSEFFRQELIHFLLLCREYEIEPRSVMGSYAGAFGQPQLIPSSFREYAVSFDDDSKPDIFNSIPDILASIANYLHRHHWVLGAPVIANIGNELKTAQLTTALETGRKGHVLRQEIVEAQGVQIPSVPDNRPLVIVEFQPNPFLGNTPQYFAGYPNFQALTAWNHSNRYAMIVTHLAQAMAR